MFRREELVESRSSVGLAEVFCSLPPRCDLARVPWKIDWRFPHAADPQPTRKPLIETARETLFLPVIPVL